MHLRGQRLNQQNNKTEVALAIEQNIEEIQEVFSPHNICPLNQHFTCLINNFMMTNFILNKLLLKRIIKNYYLKRNHVIWVKNIINVM